jgi:opacity protein-like surface antigen
MQTRLALGLGASACAALLFASTAASADGYVRGGLKDAPCCDSWSGFYLGIHGGYGWKDNDFAEVISVIPLVTLGGIDSRGGLFGFQAGYNWQRGPIVGGLEIDFTKSWIDGTSAPVRRTFAGGISITDTEGDDVQWLGSARARLGYAFGGDRGGCCSNFLLYGTGGLAWERVDRIDTTQVVTPAVTQLATTRDPRDWFGWVAGAGAEARLGGTGWIGRIEYLHYDFGTVEATTTVVTTPATPGGTFSDSAGRQTIDIVRAGLSYKF